MLSRESESERIGNWQCERNYIESQQGVRLKAEGVRMK
jgi:hypothetical protein